MKKKRVARLLGLALALFFVMLVPGFDSKAAGYPTIYPKDSNYTVTVEQNQIALIKYTIFPKYHNEKVTVRVYDSQGYEVANAIKDFYNADGTSIINYTVTWDTSNVGPGRYRVEAQMSFYTLYNWYDAPTSLTTEVVVTSPGKSKPTTQPSQSKNGWKRNDGNWNFIKDNGDLATGWQKISGKWYYFDRSGAMLSGWQKISGKWYYLKGGVMQTGWLKVSGKWYYFNNGGKMLSGWQKISGKWYYLKDGAMMTGWFRNKGKWYFFNKNGAMVTGSRKISGKTYKFNSSGVCLNP